MNADQARRAVTAVVPAFEINQKRLPPDSKAGLRVADNLSNWGIVIGAECSQWGDLHEMTVTLSDAEGIVESIASPGHIDDHFESLATLANRLQRFGQQLRAGQYVITGAFGKAPFSAGTFSGEFDGGIGTVEITLR